MTTRAARIRAAERIRDEIFPKYGITTPEHVPPALRDMTPEDRELYLRLRVVLTGTADGRVWVTPRFAPAVYNRRVASLMRSDRRDLGRDRPSPADRYEDYIRRLDQRARSV